MKASDVFEEVRAMLSEWTEDGSIIPDVDIADIQAKFLKFINMGQRALHKIGGMEKTYEFFHKPFENLLGNSFESKEFIGDIVYIPSQDGVLNAKNYIIEVNNEITIDIQENQSGTWVTLSTIAVPNTVSIFTSYKGLITATGNVRIRLSGSTFCRYQNYAMFSEPFKLTQIPSYRPYSKIELPSDFNTIDKIVKEDEYGNYYQFSDYKFEDKNNFYINWNFEGNVRLVYNPTPIKITALTDDIQVNDVFSNALVYFCTSKIAVDGYQELVNFAEQLYNEELIKIQNPEPANFEQIEDVYGGFEVY